MALAIVKYFYDRPSQTIGIIWFAISLLRSVVVDSPTNSFYQFIGLHKYTAGDEIKQSYEALNQIMKR